MPFNFNFKSTGFHLNNALKTMVQPKVQKYLQPKNYQPPHVTWNKYLKRTGRKGF